MSSWLEDLERSLEERLDAFLRANPYQTVLLEEQELEHQGNPNSATQS